MKSDKTSLRKNPSRETCENIIRRILMTEILETGKNEHFRSAADFMSYFESLFLCTDKAGAARYQVPQYAEG